MSDLSTPRAARAWLSRVTEPGDVALHRFVEAHGPVEAVGRLLADDVPGRIGAAVSSRRRSYDVQDELGRAASLGIRFVTPEDDEWPTQALQPVVVAAAQQPDGRDAVPSPDLRYAPPVGLWARGDVRLDVAFARSVAIVGSRAATSYGDHMAVDLGYDLADRGWTVVSGGAYGIDGAAHRGALAGGGVTVAVLAGGLDAPYPAGHRDLFATIAESGLLVSEWPIRAASQRHRFLIRNRLIGGMTAGTVVVEAAARSGARATARWVGEYGRTLMVVPGAATSAMSVGSHQLLRQHDTRIVTRAAEVVEEVGAIGADLADPVRGPSSARDLVDDVARQVLEGVPLQRSARTERIAEVSGVPIREVLRALPLLQLFNLVEERGGRWRQPKKETDRASG